MAALLDTPIRTSAQNLDRVLALGLPTLLVLEKPGCEPCRQLEPALNEMARTYSGRALIVRVDDAQQGDVAAHYHAARVPTLVFLRDGKEAARIEGAPTSGALRAHLDFVLGLGSQPAPVSGPSVALPGAVADKPAGPTASETSGAPVAVTDASFESQVLQSSLPIVVDFWAPWCGPCRMISPIVEGLGREYAGRVRVAKVNTDDNPDWAMRLGVRGIPTLIFFKDGREVDRVVGATSKDLLKSRFERIVKYL